jgi:putative oxidoreductase
MLAAEGARVVACSRTAEDLDALVAAVTDAGGKATAMVADLATAEGVEAAAAAALAQLGSVDILVNNVGGSRPKKFLALEDQDWLDAMELNFLSTVRMTTRLLPQMMERGSGAIVNMASIVALEPPRFVAPYAAAKAALIAYTKVLADIAAPSGVRANCVLPGLIETSATHRNAAISAEATGKSQEEVMAAMLEQNPIPLGRLGAPEDIAAMVRLLVSPDGSFITGSTFVVDGGAHRSV